MSSIKKINYRVIVLSVIKEIIEANPKVRIKLNLAK